MYVLIFKYLMNLSAAEWSDPDCCSGMMLRAEGTTCSGYDYYNPYLDGIR